MTIYRNNQQQYHRLDGPAIIWLNGDTEWWVNGQRHRADGPAVEYGDGYKAYWVNGVRHRLDGPAVDVPTSSTGWGDNKLPIPIGPSGYELVVPTEYWVNGIKYDTYLEYLVAVEEYKQIHVDTLLS